MGEQLALSSEDYILLWQATRRCVGDSSGHSGGQGEYTPLSSMHMSQGCTKVHGPQRHTHTVYKKLNSHQNTLRLHVHRNRAVSHCLQLSGLRHAYIKPGTHPGCTHRPQFPSLGLGISYTNFTNIITKDTQYSHATVSHIPIDAVLHTGLAHTHHNHSNISVTW